MADVVERLNAALEGRYRIERELGAGGMATVYLAEDLRHDRKVAVKVLKPELTAVLGADRFIQEIKTTASLQHPHILPLHDSGTADGFLFYVMPYIEGETLRDKLDRETQFGIDEAVRITREVADALDYAHRHGIIHRDIKPENILLHDGRPMVADFGIALAVSAAAGGRMTETGTSVGTPHYMSPEQATGDKQITGRADIYSLASVLYEMLTGHPPHTGSSAQQVIMRIIADTPRPVTEARKSVPPNVAAAVMNALEKLPADRFDSAKAFADALADPHFTTATVTGLAPGAVPGVRVWLRHPFSWAALAIAAVAVLLAAWRITVSGESADGPVLRAEIEILPGVDGPVSTRALDISPDGSAIAYSTLGAEAPPVLMLRRLEDRAPRAIPGTEGAVAVAFSPDGQSLAFAVREAGIRRVPLGGGAVQSVVNDTSIDYVQGLRWATDGYLYYDNNYPPSISRVPALGGVPERLLADTLSPLGYRRNISQTGDPKDPVPLPGGRHVLYTECCGEQYGDVHALDLTTGETRSLGVRASRVVYMESGYLLLIRPDGIDARLFDARRLEFRGEPFTVLDSVSANGMFRMFAVSRNGSAVYTVSPAQGSLGRATLSLVDLDGSQQPLPLPEVEFYLALKFSPDGRSIVGAARSSSASPVLDLVVHDLLIGGTSRRSIRNVRDVAWMPDGRRLLISMGAEGGRVSAILIAQADGTGVPDTLLTAGPGEEFTGLSIAPDGRYVLVGTSGRDGKSDLHVTTLDSTIGPLSDYLAADWVETRGAISPDGAWVAYESDEEPTIGYPRRVYARTFPVPGERFTVSDGNGARPLWAPDGRTIYYWTEGALIAATVQTSPTFAVTGRRTLFQLPGITQQRRYDIHPDGTRFVMETLSADTLGRGRIPEPMRLVIVGNWIDEFMRKAEAGR